MRDPHLLTDRRAIRRFGRRVLDLALQEIPAGGRARRWRAAGPAAMDRLFDRRLPVRGAPAAAILSELRRTVIPHSMPMSHPRLFGLFTPSPLPVAALGDLLGAFLNQSADAWKAGPAAVHLEMRLVRWINDRIGFGPRAFGVFTSGGGVANTLALKMARDRALGPGTRVAGSRGASALRVYASDQAHFSLARALDLLGIGSRALVPIPTDRSRRLRAAPLARAIERDRRRGLRPMAIVATAGTTNTGTLDPLPEIAACARAARAPLHVDAAYGGALLFSRRHRRRLRGLRLADTVTIDPHKWLFQPFSLGGLFARDGRALRRSFATEPEYLRKDLEADRGRVDFYHYSLEGSRPFRGLKLWMTLRLLGAGGLGDLVDRTVEAARHLDRRLRADPRFETAGAPVELASVCARYLPPWARGRPGARGPAERARLNRAQTAIQRAVERGGFAWFPAIRLEGEVFLRLGVFNYRTTPREVDAVVEHIARTARRLGL